jgi:hypothetical protein
MPFSLTCACGARLEIDDKFAGQALTCPDCQRPLQTPGGPEPVRRTSWLALTSILLALVGAFTIIGTVLAIVLGVLALVQMVGRSDRLAGRGYAIAGIVLGVLFTGGTLFALTSVELFGLSAMMNDAYWQGKLDYSGPLEIKQSRQGFAITRPSDKWGVYQSISADHVAEDLLIVRPDEDAVVLCFADQIGRDAGMERCRERVMQILRGEKFGLFISSRRSAFPPQVSEETPTRPPTKDGVDRIEIPVNKKVGSEDKRFLVLILKRRNDDMMYVAVAGTRRNQFSKIEPELRQALDSFRILDRLGRD